MITEAQIDSVIAKMEEDNFQDTFAQEEGEYWHYLNSDSFKGLTTVENQLSFFINSVIFHTCSENHEALPEFDIDRYQEKEESNWSEREKHKTWLAAKDSYFDNYTEEDLLAFVEDMLTDEENELSEISKEVIFITAKSYVDFLFSPAS